VRVQIDGELLTVVATVPAAYSGMAINSERDLGECEREFTLTPDLDLGRLSRSLADGVLTMVIPRHGSMVNSSSES